MKKREEIVEEYLKAIEIAVENSGTLHFWPADPGQMDSYFIDLFAINIFEKFKKDREKFEKALFPLSPNILRWFILPFVVLGLKLARKYEDYQVKSPEMVDFITSVREVLKRKVHSHPFCLDGENKILSNQQIKKIVNDLDWLDTKEKRVVNFLSVDLESFVWSINYDLYAYAVTWHGPYCLLENKTLLVKSFFDLNSKVWQNNIRYSSVDLHFLFKSPINVQIDFMTHMRYPATMWERLEKFAVIADEKSVEKGKDISKLDAYFEESCAKQTKRVNSLLPQDIIYKAAEINYYMFRKFFDFYEESWQPPQELTERIQSWGLKYWKMFAPKKNEKPAPIGFIRKLYDPRNDFTG